MTPGGFLFSLMLYKGDGSPLARARVTVDWAPAEEWARLEAFRRGDIEPGEARLGAVEPLWHEKVGPPVVRGFRIGVAGREAPPVCSEFATTYFRDLAEAASAQLVDKGEMKSGEEFRYVVMAHAAEAEAAAARVSGPTAEVKSPLHFRRSRLDEFLDRAAVSGEVDPVDVPVFVPADLLDEIRAQSAGAGDCETGGVLIGHLHRDAAAAVIFVEITAQIPARGAPATDTRLSFTPDTWTAVRAALDLRRRQELMLGWWHRHPVKVWCRDCPPERQRVCRLTSCFFSQHDRHLHRTVFPGAWNVALVMNDTATDMTFSLFGWRAGRIEERGFHIVPAATDSTPRPALIAAKGD